jgi:hypothetical protein
MDNNDVITKSLDKIITTLDKHTEDLSTLKVHSATQNVLLEEHERRSLAQEENVALLRTELKPVFTQSTIIGWISKVGALLISGGLLTLVFQYVVKKLF